MRARRFSLLSLTLPAMVLGTFVTAGPVSAAPCDTSGTSLGNGGFETPVVPPASNTNFVVADIPPWQTTDGAGWIEIWGDGFDGVPADEGNAFAELNATTPGTLYQDVVSVPGSTMTWTLAHRGRLGDDSMQVLIGDANLADVNGADGWAYISADLTDGTSAWGVHSDDYLVPTGQTCTRFAFRAVTSVGGASFGNFLDAVSFTTTIPAPPSSDPTPDGSVAAVTPPPTDASIDASEGSDGGWSAVGLVGAILATALGLHLARTRTTRRQRP